MSKMQKRQDNKRWPQERQATLYMQQLRKSICALAILCLSIMVNCTAAPTQTTATDSAPTQATPPDLAPTQATATNLAPTPPTPPALAPTQATPLALAPTPPTTTALDPTQTYTDIIPPVNYGTLNDVYIGEQFPPVAIANQCLFYFSYVNNATAWEYGVYVAKWLALRARDAGSKGIYFTYEFPWPIYQLPSGWVSGLAQGKVAECFLQAEAYTGDSKFRELAKRSLQFLAVSIDQGGVAIADCDALAIADCDALWYAEYASTEGMRSYVLNGHQFTLLGIHEYLKEDNDPQIRMLFDKGLKALEHAALTYDNGVNNSYYDRLGHAAGKYHNTHIINFQKLYDITEDQVWLTFKDVFAN